MSTVFSRARWFSYLMAAGVVILASMFAAGQAHADTKGITRAGYFYGFNSLERLWISAGGSWSTASRAACIASHESGGYTGAVSPTNDWGLWQIHDGGYPMLNPWANARRAVAMSYGGRNFSAWTTAYLC